MILPQCGRGQLEMGSPSTKTGVPACVPKKGKNRTLQKVLTHQLLQPHRFLLPLLTFKTLPLGLKSTQISLNRIFLCWAARKAGSDVQPIWQVVSSVCIPGKMPMASRKALTRVGERPSKQNTVVFFLNQPPYCRVNSREMRCIVLGLLQVSGQ